MTLYFASILLRQADCAASTIVADDYHECHARTLSFFPRRPLMSATASQNVAAKRRHAFQYQRSAMPATAGQVVTADDSTSSVHAKIFGAHMSPTMR